MHVPAVHQNSQCKTAASQWLLLVKFQFTACSAVIHHACFVPCSIAAGLLIGWITSKLIKPPPELTMHVIVATGLGKHMPIKLASTMQLLHCTLRVLWCVCNCVSRSVHSTRRQYDTHCAVVCALAHLARFAAPVVLILAALSALNYSSHV